MIGSSSYTKQMEKQSGQSRLHRFVRKAGLAVLKKSKKVGEQACQEETHYSISKYGNVEDGPKAKIIELNPKHEPKDEDKR